MKRRIDKDGFFIEDVADEEENVKGREDDTQLIDADPPSGFYKPRWNGKAWEEGEAPEEGQARTRELDELVKENDAKKLRYTYLETSAAILNRAGSFDAMTEGQRTSIIGNLIKICMESIDASIDYDL